LFLAYSYQGSARSATTGNGAGQRRVWKGGRQQGRRLALRPAPMEISGSPIRIRTLNLAVNSRPLYR
jgi:hypothetical protein